MVCWYKCCPCVFHKTKPKRMLFKWDIVAMTLLTAHDIIAMFISVLASMFHRPEVQHPPYRPYIIPALVFFMLVCNLAIIYTMVEHGFRLLEEGPMVGKVVIALLHLVPSAAYIGVVQINFVYYMGFHGVIDDPPAHIKEEFTEAALFGDVYGISVFHHIYVVLFEVLMSVCVFICCRQKKIQKVTPEELGLLAPSEHVALGDISVKLQLSSDKRIFYPGKPIGGSVIIEGLPANVTCAVKVELWGKAIVKWKQGRCCLTSLPREGVEDILSEIAESDKFQFILPPNSPPSFTCGDEISGTVSYGLTATVNMQNGSPPFSLELPFLVKPVATVTSPKPNDYTSYEENCNLPSLFGCCALQNGPYGFNLIVPKTQFIIGEEINFSAKLFNKSRRPVLSVSASLISPLRLVDDTHGFRFVEETIKVWSEVKHAGMKALAVERWRDVLKIPDNIPESAGLPLSNGIKFKEYLFRFEVEIRGLSENAVVEIPLTIGAPAPPKPKKSVII